MCCILINKGPIWWKSGRIVRQKHRIHFDPTFTQFFSKFRTKRCSCFFGGKYICLMFFVFVFGRRNSYWVKTFHGPSTRHRDRYRLRWAAKDPGGTRAHPIHPMDRPHPSDLDSGFYSPLQSPNHIPKPLVTPQCYITHPLWISQISAPKPMRAQPSSSPSFATIPAGPTTPTPTPRPTLPSHPSSHSTKTPCFEPLRPSASPIHWANSYPLQHHENLESPYCLAHAFILV